MRKLVIFLVTTVITALILSTSAEGGNVQDPVKCSFDDDNQPESYGEARSKCNLVQDGNDGVTGKKIPHQHSQKSELRKHRNSDQHEESSSFKKTEEPTNRDLNKPKAHKIKKARNSEHPKTEGTRTAEADRDNKRKRERVRDERGVRNKRSYGPSEKLDRLSEDENEELSEKKTRDYDRATRNFKKSHIGGKKHRKSNKGHRQKLGELEQEYKRLHKHHHGKRGHHKRIHKSKLVKRKFSNFESSKASKNSKLSDDLKEKFDERKIMNENSEGPKRKMINKSEIGESSGKPLRKDNNSDEGTKNGSLREKHGSIIAHRSLRKHKGDPDNLKKAAERLNNIEDQSVIIKDKKVRDRRQGVENHLSQIRDDE